MPIPSRALLRSAELGMKFFLHFYEIAMQQLGAGLKTFDGQRSLHRSFNVCPHSLLDNEKNWMVFVESLTGIWCFACKQTFVIAPYRSASGANKRPFVHGAGVQHRVCVQDHAERDTGHAA